jgi:hypothetical protein
MLVSWCGARQVQALRLLCRMWQHNHRCFSTLKAALVAKDSTSVETSVEMRLGRAACVRDVCTDDPVKGTELVLLIQVTMPLASRPNPGLLLFRR